MNDSTKPVSYKGFRFPQEIITHTVWLYHRFSLRLRNVEELLYARGIVVKYETVRQWCRKFGQAYANQLRHRATSGIWMKCFSGSTARGITSGGRWTSTVTSWA